MINKRIIFYLLGAFLAGNMLFILIQYITAEKTGNLIDGNIKLLNEIKVTSDLKELEIDISTVETNSRKIFSQKDSAHVRELQGQIKEVKEDMAVLQKISDDDSTVKYVDVLDTLIRHKLVLSQARFTNAYVQEKNTGADAAVKNIEINYASKLLTDSIVRIIHKIDSSRLLLWQKVTLANDRSGKQALLFGNVLTGLVLLIGAASFWYIINVVKNQTQLINQLNISEKKERESAKIKDNFLANMSHEIRTPLNAILGFTNLLQRKAADAETKGYVQTIQKSGENLLNIVNDILDLSKIEAGMIRIEPAPFSLRNTIHAVEKLFAEKALEKEIALTVSVDDNLPDGLFGDAGRLTQILVNMVSNALKFTGSGSVAVNVTQEANDNGKIDTGITVSDTGIGIPADKTTAIFERFMQAEDSVTRHYGGTGLGLAIVKDLVLLQGGTINVNSTPGTGTIFKIVIPYRMLRAKTMDNNLQQQSPYAEVSFNGVQVLVAEDNEINQSLLKHLFNYWQIPFDMVNNGKEVLEILSREKYDLILMDIQMPEMDGYTAASQIRERLHLSTPIIAMTAHALAGEREKCLGFGMNDYISKPIKEEELYTLIGLYTQIKKALIPPAAITANPVVFKYINLQYMQEVGMGNKDYEKTVTGQFTEAVPQDLLAMQHAWQQHDVLAVSKIAHNLKTTVSVMGLNDLLQPHLDALEYTVKTDNEFQQQFSVLHAVLQSAVAEAKQLYASFN